MPAVRTHKQKVKELQDAQGAEAPGTSTTTTVPGAEAKTRQRPTFVGNSASIPVTASAQIMVVSDTEGVDFGPYLNKQVLPTLQKAWAKLAPSVAGSSAVKGRGKTVIEFAIEKNGSVAGLKLKESTNDATLDAALLDSLKSVAVFQALPAQFKGKSLALRFDLSFRAVAAGE